MTDKPPIGSVATEIAKILGCSFNVASQVCSLVILDPAWNDEVSTISFEQAVWKHFWTVRRDKLRSRDSHDPIWDLVIELPFEREPFP